MGCSVFLGVGLGIDFPSAGSVRRLWLTRPCRGSRDGKKRPCCSARGAGPAFHRREERRDVGLHGRWQRRCGLCLPAVGLDSVLIVHMYTSCRRRSLCIRPPAAGYRPSPPECASDHRSALALVSFDCLSADGFGDRAVCPLCNERSAVVDPPRSHRRHLAVHRQRAARYIDRLTLPWLTVASVLLLTGMRFSIGSIGIFGFRWTAFALMLVVALLGDRVRRHSVSPTSTLEPCPA